MSRKCIMGCPKEENLHRFPRNPTRRAEWLRILCINSKTKRLYACSRHFSKEFIFGNKVSKFAVPRNECPEPIVNFSINREMSESDSNPIPISSLTQNEDIQTNDNPTKESVTGNDMINEVSQMNIDDLGLDDGITTKNFGSSKTDSSKLKTLRAALDHHRTQYLAERRLNSTFRAANVKLSKELEKCKEKIKKLELELKKKNDMSSKVSNSMSVCIENSLINHNREAKNRRYSIGIKLISLAVYFLSPLVYRYMSKLLDWPDVRTLRRFANDWPKTPGNLNGTFEALKLRAREFKEEEKYVSVSCDEMSLKTFLEYDRFKDKIIGLQDFGDENRSRNLATSAMVIMASGIGGSSWSQAVSYFFVNGNCKGSVMKKYIIEAIFKLEAIGLKPCQFVCDQGANFVNFSKIVQVSEQRPYFEVNNRRIHFMHDSPHLLKSARNCLLNLDHKIYFNNRLVSWRDVMHFFKVDSNSLKCAPKLSMEHINPNNFQRMRVNLAAQVLSRTVAKGMRTLQASGKLDPRKSLTFLSTAEYLEFFNDLFDIFNSRAEYAVFKNSEQQLEILRQASKALKTFKIIDEKGTNITKTFKFINGWLTNISALKSLWSYLSHEGFQGLKTRRLTQDHLEHFFGQIRKGSGNSVRITPRNFSSSFQKRWGLHYVNVVVNGNCEDISPEDKILDFSIVDLAYSFDPNNTQWDDFHALPNPCPSIKETDVRDKSLDSDERSVLEKNAFVYICGYFYYKLHQAHACASPLPTFEQYEDISNDYYFTYVKQFDKCHLVKPPQGFVDYFKILETKFHNLFNYNCHRQGIRQIIFDGLSQEKPYLCCDVVKHEDILNLFIRIRIYFILKYFNAKLKEPTFKQKYLCVSNK